MISEEVAHHCGANLKDHVDCCAICLERVGSTKRVGNTSTNAPGHGSGVGELECKHTFCMSCIQDWVLSSEQKPSCPKCRVPISAEAALRLGIQYVVNDDQDTEDEDEDEDEGWVGIRRDRNNNGFVPGVFVDLMDDLYN